VARRSIVVVGGGIAGLAAAYELSGGRAGPNGDTPRVELIESSERLGGSLAATSFAGRVVDLGPDGVLARRPEALGLIDDLGLSGRVEPIAASGAWIWLRGGLREVPPGLTLGIPTDPASLRGWPGLSRRARFALARDRLMPARLEIGDDATIGQIVRTKLGQEVAHSLVEPMIGGIQAGRIDDLSARSVFPALYDAARRGGSLAKALRAAGPSSPGPSHEHTPSGPAFVTLTSAMGSLPDALVETLARRGVIVRTAVPVTALRPTPSGSYPWEVDTASTTTPADAVVLATPAPVAAALAGRHHGSIAALAGVASAGAAMVTLSLQRDAPLPGTGTGVLVPLASPWRGEGSLLVTALTFLDRKWPHLVREDDVLVRAHVGRIDDERWRDLDDAALVARAHAELEFLFGAVGEPRAALVQRWPQGLPQYRLGHANMVDEARVAAGALGITLVGSAYDGVGIPASIGSARRGARVALERLA
jgi:protoporphyrinogen/coproporphyrinogen III oxidase